MTCHTIPYLSRYNCAQKIAPRTFFRGERVRELYIGLHHQSGMVLGLEVIWTAEVCYWTRPRSSWRGDTKGPRPI